MRISDWSSDVCSSDLTVRSTPRPSVISNTAFSQSGGAGTLEKSIAATRIAGTIGFIGVLAGGQVNPRPIMAKSLTLQGIYVGSRNLFRAMNRAIAASGLRPVKIGRAHV